MKSIKFVKVVTKDLIVEVEALADKIWYEHYIPIIGKEQVDYMLGKFQSYAAISDQIKDGFLYFLIKEQDSGYVGYIGALPKADEMFLSKIYVISEKRGQGYGKQAMSFVEQLAKDKGCTKITLTVNKNNYSSIKMYEKYGFSNSGSLVQDIGRGFVMDDYKMEKIL